MPDPNWPEAVLESRNRLREKGLNLWGVARIKDHDACQAREWRLCERARGKPRSVVVIGAGGSEMWHTVLAMSRFPATPRRGFHPLDEFSRETIEDEVRTLCQAGFAVDSTFPFDSKPLDFVTLAESAGLGVRSPVVPFLLHPDYGPWVSLRGALLFEEELEPSGELTDFEPCVACHCPCLDACPAGAYGPAGIQRLDLCAENRHSGGCGNGCEVRRACPVGADRRYDPDEELFRHFYSLPLLQRYFGLGLWKFVPGPVRRRRFL